MVLTHYKEVKFSLEYLKKEYAVWKKIIQNPAVGPSELYLAYKAILHVIYNCEEKGVMEGAGIISDEYAAASIERLIYETNNIQKSLGQSNS